MDNSRTACLEEANFPGRIHWTLNWLIELIQRSCPVRWQLAQQ
ncbi:hypothetical protein ACFYXH_35865 [Streptomyces sp. NPDC002730]